MAILVSETAEERTERRLLLTKPSFDDGEWERPVFEARAANSPDPTADRIPSSAIAATEDPFDSTTNMQRIFGS